MADNQTPIFFTNIEDLKDELDGGKNGGAILDLPRQAEESETWLTDEFEGQLSLDVYQTENEIVVKSTIAGVKPENLEIYLHNDVLTIRGKRDEEKVAKEADYFYKECYWGGFSRSIILPVEVQADKVEASLKNGILIVVLPKAHRSKLINVKVQQD